MLWRAKRASGRRRRPRAPKAPSPPQELGTPSPRAARARIPIYYIIRCSRMWRHSHCPSPPSFFLFRHFDSENCNLTDVNTNIKRSPSLPYLFITAYFGSYRSREGVMGAFPHPTFSCARPLFPFVLSLKSFVRPLLSYDS